MATVASKKPSKHGFLRRHWFGLIFSVSFVAIFVSALMMVGSGGGGGEGDGGRGIGLGPFAQFTQLLGSSALRIDTMLGVVGISAFIGGFGLRDMLARRSMKRAAAARRPDLGRSG